MCEACAAFRRSLAAAALVTMSAIAAIGCSPVLAAKQPGRKDVDLLAEGMPRNLIVAEFGTPVSSELRAGQRVEVYAFVQGYRKGVRVARTIGHVAGDVATLGLWEVAGTPTEATLNGHRVAYEITFDDRDRVERVVALKE
ncbi:MAG TPA: hypothetical protein VFA59_13520 [Vicinamibacterales bacterium]|nr:hypothetical protein [Vicinamibacterales bacterium]